MALTAVLQQERIWLSSKFQTLTSSMSTFSGAITKQMNKSLTASASTFDAVLSTLKIISIGGRILIDKILGILTTKLNRITK